MKYEENLSILKEGQRLLITKDEFKNNRVNNSNKCKIYYFSKIAGLSIKGVSCENTDNNSDMVVIRILEVFAS